MEPQLLGVPVQYQTKSPLPDPAIRYLGGKLWELCEEVTYYDREHGCLLRVPAGFVFDLASVPRGVWWLIAPFELSIIAALLHDMLYGCGGCMPVDGCDPHRTYTRGEADDLFRRVMVDERVPAWRRKLSYQAVRTFGAPAWKGL